MNANVAFFEETQYLRDSTLSAPLWFAPQASTSQDELDKLHHPWRTQQEAKVSSGPKLLIKVSGTTPSWLPDSVHDLNYILTLKENWDSYGAHKVQPKTAVTAIQIMLAVMKGKTPVPSIVPTPTGSIQLEWHKYGIDLEVEIAASGNYSISFEDETGQAESWEDEHAHHPDHIHQHFASFIDLLTERTITEE